MIGALPLRNMSRLWGYVNSLELPIWFRSYGLGFYAYAFGCNLDEIEPSDLREYPSLGAFFYRKLKDGTRPVDSASLVCTKTSQLIPIDISNSPGKSGRRDCITLRHCTRIESGTSEGHHLFFGCFTRH